MNGISVIIPTLNRTDFLKQTLDCLIKQEFDYPFEILIVDQSNEEDAEILEYQKKYSFIRYFHITFFRGLPEARNFGWQQANYDYILYLDDDITCKDNLLKEHCRYIMNPEIGIVAGGITEKFGKNVNCKTGKFKKFTANPNAGYHNKGQYYVNLAKGCNFSTKKDALLKACGFDENLTKGAALYEETDFCLRVQKCGYKIFFNSEAHVNHLAAPTGGCRVNDIQKYIFNLSRNRSIIISRHLKWYHNITAYLYLFKLILAYSLSYKKVSIMRAGIKGVYEGRKIGKQQIKYSNYK